jgi:hypothetical protein
MTRISLLLQFDELPLWAQTGPTPAGSFVPKAEVRD